MKLLVELASAVASETWLHEREHSTQTRTDLVDHVGEVLGLFPIKFHFIRLLTVYHMHQVALGVAMPREPRQELFLIQLICQAA